MLKRIVPFAAFIAQIEKAERLTTRTNRVSIGYMKRLGSVQEFLTAAAIYADKQLRLNSFESLPNFWRTLNTMNAVIQTSSRASERFAHDTLVLGWLEPMLHPQAVTPKEIAFTQCKNIESVANAILMRDSDNPLLDRALEIWNASLERLATHSFPSSQAT